MRGKGRDKRKRVEREKGEKKRFFNQFVMFAGY